MALDFPNSPTIGDEFTGGGFTWVWTGDSWDKVMASVATGGNGFSLLVGATGNTTYAFDTPQPAGAYSLTSQLGDTTFDIYLVTAANANAGYTNTTALEATAEFDRIVVYGATTNDILNFEYKPSAAPATSGDVADGAAPFLTSATPATLASVDDTTTVTGGNFASDVEIVFTGQDDVDRPAKNIVRSSSTSLIVTRPDTFPVEQEPFTMTATNAGITNPSTNVNKLTDYFDAGGGITWVTTSPLPEATINVAYSTTLEATDADSTSVVYSLTSGSLPTGLSLNGSTGAISGTPTVVESETFTITATDAGGNSSAREFSLTVALPVLEYLVIAGGGGGADGGGGGAGGYRTGTFSFDSSSYTVTIGAGGALGTDQAKSSSGINSTFNLITSAGGGGAGGEATDTNQIGIDGGSGGGGGNPASYQGTGAGGAGNVPLVSPSQGNNGGVGQHTPGSTISGGGGGGSSGVGGNASARLGGNGGAGTVNSITGSAVTYAIGGRGKYMDAVAPPATMIANTGNGGHAGYHVVEPVAGNSGVVILRYPSYFTISAGAGLTLSTDIDGDFKVTTFTAGTDTISLS